MVAHNWRASIVIGYDVDHSAELDVLLTKYCTL